MSLAAIIDMPMPCCREYGIIRRRRRPARLAPHAKPAPYQREPGRQVGKIGMPMMRAFDGLSFDHGELAFCRR